ncbi:hypothetical protein Trydic_g12437 [Trypoxylus dichotomus]
MGVRTGNVNVTEMVLERIKTNLELDKENVATGLKAIVNLFRQSDVTGYTPLELAIKQNDKEMIAMLLKYIVDVNFSTQREFTPLLATVKGNNKEIVKLLLEHKANPNHGSGLGISPLTLSIEVASMEIIQMLLDHGARVNYMTVDGKTALSESVIY